MLACTPTEEHNSRRSPTNILAGLTIRPSAHQRPSSTRPEEQIGEVRSLAGLHPAQTERETGWDCYWCLCLYEHSVSVCSMHCQLCIYVVCMWAYLLGLHLQPCYRLSWETWSCSSFPPWSCLIWCDIFFSNINTLRKQSITGATIYTICKTTTDLCLHSFQKIYINAYLKHSSIEI